MGQVRNSLFQSKNRRTTSLRSFTLLLILFAGMLPTLWRNSLGAPTAAAATHTVTATDATFLPLVAAVSGGHIQGAVFRDDDYDGVRGEKEPSVAGVKVKVYDAFGMVAETVTDDAGGYHFNGLRADISYRVEFSGLPGAHFSGPHGQDSHSSVRFVTTSPTGGAPVDFGLVDLLHGNEGNCQSSVNLPMATACYTFGPRRNAAREPAIVSFSAQAGSANRSDQLSAYDDPDGVGPLTTGRPITEALTSVLGTVNGLAYQRSTNMLYAAAFLKRHAELGEGGLGAIYRIDRNLPPGDNVSLLATVADAGDLNGKRPDNADNNYFLADPIFDEVGKMGLGDLEISADESTLYTVNLAARTLVEIPIDQPAPVSLGLIPQPGCAGGVGRPFALALRGHLLFVGGVCTAEQGGAPADLRAYVYTYDLRSRQFSGEPVLDFALDYPRNCTDRVPDRNGCQGTARWQPWVADFTKLPRPYNGAYIIHPQPWLTDIEFDHEQMVLGFRDRMGDLLGVRTSPPAPLRSTCTGNLCSTITAGDLLRAAPSATTPGKWMIEQNATAGVTSAGGANNGQGPRGGEFYFEEQFGLGTAHPRHEEIAQGGLAQLPGEQSVATTAFNPIPLDIEGATFDGGVIWLANSDGARTRSYRVYNGVSNPSPQHLFGKANGLGDLELLCGPNPLPLEIGNRVWYDRDGDGIQDPGEVGIGGVQVQLFAIDSNGGATQVAETTTNANGEYYFGGVQPEQAYQVRISLVDANLPRGAVPTAQDAHFANDGNDDLRDADGDQGLLAPGFSTIALTTGKAGQNNHSYDFGFVVPLVALGNLVWWDNYVNLEAGVTIGNGRFEAGHEQGVAGVEVQLYAGAMATGSPLRVTTTQSGGFYLFDNLAPGDYVVHIPPSQFQEGAPLAILAGTGILSSSDPNGSDSGLDDNLDENGQDPGGLGLLPTTGISSTVIHLALGAEPINEAGAKGGPTTTLPDENVNLTVDFGFFRKPIPGIDIEKNTDSLANQNPTGPDFDNEDDANGPGVPVIPAGSETVWSYKVTNTGEAPFLRQHVLVNDTTASVDAALLFDPASDVNSDNILSPGEVWHYTSTGVALDLRNPPNPLPDGVVIVHGCAQSVGGPLQPAQTYSNTATVVGVANVAGELVTLTDADDSHYCNTPPPPRVALGNLVWMDTYANPEQGIALGNGKFEAGHEQGIDGVEIHLYAGASVTGTPLQTTTTAAGGYYLFDNLEPGDYVVHIPPSQFQPGGPLALRAPDNQPFRSSDPNGGDIDLDDNADENGQNPTDPASVTVIGVSSTVIHLAAGGEPTHEPGANGGPTSTLPDEHVNLTVDFGFVPPPDAGDPELVLGNRVWRDDSVNGLNNGLIDSGEAGIAGVTLALYAVNTPDASAIATTTTNADGHYLFTELPEGSYMVEVVSSNFAPGGPLAGWVSSTPTEIDPNADLDSNDNGLDADQPAVTGIRSGPITLSDEGEPVGEDDRGLLGCGATEKDENCNLTVDFGFYRPPSNACLDANGELMMPKQVIPVRGVDANGNLIDHGPGVYTLPAGYENGHLIVKRFKVDDTLPGTPEHLKCGEVGVTFCFRMAEGSVYTSLNPNTDHPDRVYACQGNYCNSFVAAHNKPGRTKTTVDVAADDLPAGYSILTVILDDDADNGEDPVLLKNGAEEGLVTARFGIPDDGLTECGAFDIPEAANWQIRADDSIGVASCIVPTAVRQSLFPRFCPANR
jgi:hypothetical protein